MLDRVENPSKVSKFLLSDTELQPLIAFKNIFLRQNRRQAILGGWLERLPDGRL